MSFLAKSALLIFVFFMTVLSLLFMTAGIEAASNEVYGRKLVMKEVGGVWGELREAPLGPDPLHHHGSSPRKPKTP